MEYLAFAIRDSKLEDFSLPMHHQTAAAAIRAFASMTLNPENGHIHTHPDDFALFKTGTYDSSKPWRSTWDAQPTMLALATEFHHDASLAGPAADAAPAIGRHAEDDTGEPGEAEA